MPADLSRTRETGINTPDVVGVETSDGFRVSLPENPDATIVSDIWVPIEN